MICFEFEKMDNIDTVSAGGKGASLGKMSRAGLPVPPGFVVTAAAFDGFMAKVGIARAVESELEKIDLRDDSSIERASSVIRGMILQSEVPNEITREIDGCFQALGSELVAVRSSATAEDSLEDSWAGELESYLNVEAANLIGSVKNCWSSLFTPRAIFYRLEKGLGKHKVSVAVVVQKMIHSEVSGIAFTVHPVTKDYSQMLIEAGYGLGEAIVGGLVTPDTYLISKPDLTFSEKIISEQSIMIVRGPAGTRQQSVIEPKRGLQKLPDDKIVILARICVTIEKLYGFPCDIEWAYEGNRLYITQSRPITTL